MTFANRTLVIGGAASGKSRYAEEIALKSARSKVYVATAQVFDDEMAEKVQKHKLQRGDNWHTVEAPFDLCPTLDAARPDQVVLVDCLTLWLTNHILAERDIESETAKLVDAVTRCGAPVILVTNEVGAGIVPENALARRFRNAQGRLNQTMAVHCDHVITVIAGLPMTLKGPSP